MTATLIAKRRDRQRFTGGERGSATLELVIIAPVTILFIVVLILGHRVVLAGQAVEQAAEDAARTASISRNPSTAQSRARASALASLNAQNLRCSSVSVSVDTAGFAVPVGQPAEVSALVTCPVYLADLVGFGLPGSRTVTGEAVSVLDTYRERS